ncbi:hypothetical protein TNCV_2516961 [Trichonephila clavipes]|nr:hypothetical protein TNCV_2516961 [Trichonephila clavipes]
MPTQRDKPSNLGVRRRQLLTDIAQIGRISPWCTRKCNSLRASHRAGGQAGLDDDEASVSLGQVTKLAPDAKRQVFDRYRSGQMALQAEPFIDELVGPSVFGSRKEIRVIHREVNHFWIFAVLRNASNLQFDRDRFTTMVKHIGMGEKG